MRGISNSEMEVWRDCRRKWYLQYVRQLQPTREKQTGALAVGNRVHKWIENFYTKGEEYAWYDFDLTAEEDLEADGADRKAIETDLALCRAMLEGFAEWLEEEGLDSDLEILGVEEAVDVEIPGTGFTLMGKRDLTARRKSTGERVILDAKTTGDLDRDCLLAGMKSQPKVYMVMDRMLGVPNPASELIYFFLRKVKRTARAKPPFYKIHPIFHSDEELRRFYLQLVGMLKDIALAESRLSEGEDPNVVCYPTPCKDCTWKCPFFAVCPMMDTNPAGAERVFSMSYIVASPYQRYTGE